jgi:hypothetical protein
MPYNPLLNPYIINPKELPSNQTAAAAVPAWNIGTINQWCQSPSFTPNWSDETQTPGSVAAQSKSPSSVPSVDDPDSLVDARDVNSNVNLTAEKARYTSIQTAATSAITAINALTGGAPGVFSVNPATAVHAVATPVTIMGSGFSVSAPTVTIGVACTSVVVVNDGELTCTTGAASVAGTFNVVVVTSAGTGTLTAGFVFT